MIKLLVLDVDGCLTDGRIIYDTDGKESKHFNVKDGLAIASWVKMGLDVAIITGRNSPIVAKRADELGITHLFQGVAHKQKLLEGLLDELELTPDEVAAIGDDFNDYKMLEYVGRSFTPKDGVTALQKKVDTVLTCKGGEGAVREMIEILIAENGLEEKFLNLWI